MPVSAIVLDIGNVICEWNPQKLVASAFDDASQHEQALQDTVGHPDWLSLDRGTMELDVAINNARERSSLDPLCIGQLYHNTPVSLTPLPETVEGIRQAHEAGMPLYVLSNMQKHCWEHMSEQFDFWDCFTKVVVSCDVKLIKPDAAIYEYVIRECGLEPSSTVFVDDMAVNIEAAIACGWQGVQMTDTRMGGEVIRELLSG